MFSSIFNELIIFYFIDRLQQALFDHWSPHMSVKRSIVMDATYYESEVRYPTNEKLLWESTDWLHGQLKVLCKGLGVPLPRTKYLKWKKRYIFLQQDAAQDQGQA